MSWLDGKTLESVIEVEGKDQKWKVFKIINTFTKVSDSEVRVIQKQAFDNDPPQQNGSRVMIKRT
jgi:hypothetical protein